MVMLDRIGFKHFVAVNDFGNRICRTAFHFVITGPVVFRAFPSNGRFTVEAFAKCMCIYIKASKTSMSSTNISKNCQLCNDIGKIMIY